MRILCSIAVVTSMVLPGAQTLPAQRAPKIHELKASSRTVHRGFFDASLKPVLTIDSGDIVKLETATGNPRYFEQLGVPKEKIPAELYDVFEGVDNGALTSSRSQYLPVLVPGALLSVCDGHGAQSYGEVCLSAIETSLKVEIQLIVHKNTSLKQPRAETPTHFMTMGLHTNLDEA